MYLFIVIVIIPGPAFETTHISTNPETDNGFSRAEATEAVAKYQSVMSPKTGMLMGFHPETCWFNQHTWFNKICMRNMGFNCFF